MDGQDYLNQISADIRPVQPSKLHNILTSKFFLVGVIFVAALIIILIIGSVLSANKSNTKNLSFALNLHLDNTKSVINTYQKELKSSNLRSYSASLVSILSKTHSDLTEYLTAKYDYNPGKIDSKIVDQATLEKDGLESELFEAKINGNLDRVYAHKMAYEISILSAEETKIHNTSKDENLKSILNVSYDSLSKLYDNFNNYSETQ